MNELAPVITRLVLRYVSGGLMAWGFVSPETGAVLVADADLQALILTLTGAAIAALTELAYAHARRTGAPT